MSSHPRTCIKCGIQKKATEFRVKRSKSKLHKPWRGNICLVCDLQIAREYRSTPEYKARRAKQVRERVRRDPLFHLKKNIHSAIYRCFKLKGVIRHASTFLIIGCDFDTLKTHIEKQFTEGMTWANMGEWHIDHKVPMASAKNKLDVIMLSHYSNLQPLWKLENLRKGTRLAA